MAAQLSVSAPGMDCVQVAETLRACGVRCDVTPNVTVMCPVGETCRVEPGCRVLLGDGWGGGTAWRALQDAFGLQCAHVAIPGGHNGCVRDLERPSSCPG